MTTSSSSVLAPISKAFSIDGMVFSGSKPLAPRCPCRSGFWAWIKELNALRSVRLRMAEIDFAIA